VVRMGCRILCSFQRCQWYFLEN